jgi:hypothetical protein
VLDLVVFSELELDAVGAHRPDLDRAAMMKVARDDEGLDKEASAGIELLAHLLKAGNLIRRTGDHEYRVEGEEGQRERPSWHSHL